MTDIRHVTYSYDGATQPSLHDVSLTIRPGESVLLCGPSGSGKSSLVRLLNGLIPHYHEGTLSGTVQHGDYRIDENPLYETARYMATVFQNPRTQFFTTQVTSELAFGLENRGEDPRIIRQRLQDITQDMRIDHLLHRSLFCLSGGEQQKVACASARMANPEIYLFDEPTSNLDPAAIQDFRHTYAELRAQGATLVVAEHRVYFLRGLIDRVFYVDNGRIVRELSAEEFWDLSEEERQKWSLRSLTAPPQPALPAPALPAEDAAPEDRAPGAAAGVGVHDVHFSYGHRRVLNIPHLFFPRGAVTVLTGVNGAGKTTLARILTGLSTPDTGTITWDGVATSARQRMADSYLVMQDVHRQLFAATVHEEVSITAHDGVDVEEILRSCDLAEYATSHPLCLSGGQKQRVVTATAVASNKKLLIFDEPSSGLDYQHMVQLAALLRELATPDRVVIVITHDYELIDLCGDLQVELIPGSLDSEAPCEEPPSTRL